MKIKLKPTNKLYAIHYKNQLLSTVDWEGGTASTLQGWRPAKKVYFTLGTAKSGITHIPELIRKDCSIVEYAPNTKTSTLKFDETAFQIRRLKVKIKEHKRTLKYYLDRDGFTSDKTIEYKKELADLKNQLNDLEKL